MRRRFLVLAALILSSVGTAWAEDGLESVAARLEVQVNTVGIATGTGATDMGVGFVWLLEDGRAWPVDEAPFDRSRIEAEMLKDPEEVLAWRRRDKGIELRDADETDWDDTLAEIRPVAGLLSPGIYFKVPWTPDNLKGFRGRAYEFKAGAAFELAEVSPGSNEYFTYVGGYDIDGYTLTLTHQDGRTEQISVLPDPGQPAADGEPRYVWLNGEQYERF